MDDGNEKRDCFKCRNTRVVRVLGSGGDFESWPCPECRQPEYDKALVDAFSSGYCEGD